MTSHAVTPARRITGEITVPGDKSISHRSIILGSLARGTTVIRGLLRGEDNMATLAAFRRMGIGIRDDGETVTVEGKGLYGLSEPDDVIDCGNSGTSMRLLTGLLAAQPFFSVLTGDRYLRRRPMRRVVEPLTRMGGEIHGRDGGERAPLAIVGRPLSGIRHRSSVASAQVKSAILLAGLYADGETTVQEPHRSRDHSERMLASFGADVTIHGDGVTIRPGRELSPADIVVPGDISSAAFFMVAATIVPHSELLIRNVGVNPTRTGIIDILTLMGGNITLLNQREVSGEPVADLMVKSAPLRGVEIGGEVVPRAIDEFPVIAVAAACAEGETTIRDAAELRVKESDRISAIAGSLRASGIQVEEHPDGMTVRGGGLSASTTDSRGDHRIAMAMLVAGLAARGETVVTDVDCINTSFPTFFDILSRVVER